MSDAKENAINFEAIVKGMYGVERVAVNDLAIIGGEIDLAVSSEAVPADEQANNGQDAAVKIKAFLDGWHLDQKEMNYTIWETVDRIDMLPTSDQPTVDAEFRRARIFGKDGDLSLRIDGKRLLWHFIGAKDKAPKINNACDFLQARKEVTELRCQENQKALLWGEKSEASNPDDVRWLEDRVRVADLKYPGMETEDAERVRIVYNVYWHSGQPVFYWLHGLEPVPKKKENNGENNGQG